VTQADLDALYANEQLQSVPASPVPPPVTLHIPRC
jgi:phosphonate transport system ATP-binding protein